jgi:PAS domain S-box-containing protein
MRTELLEAEQMLPQLFRNSGVGFAIFDENFRYQMVNPYLAATHGASVEAHLGKHIREILGEVGAQAEPAIQHVLATGHSVVNYEVAGAFKSRPQGGRWMGTLFPITGSDGDVRQVGVLVVELGPKVDFEKSPSIITPTNAILRSWKEIALYVGSCVKTVQRWEHDHHFPIHRVINKKGAVVLAFKDEIERWLRNRVSPERTYRAL